MWWFKIIYIVRQELETGDRKKRRTRSRTNIRGNEVEKHVRMEDKEEKRSKKVKKVIKNQDLQKKSVKILLRHSLRLLIQTAVKLLSVLKMT